MGGIEELKTMKTQLVSCVQGQLGDLAKVDTKQLGQAIDMIKDLSQAIYYCTITESMEKVDKEEVKYYTPSYNKMYPDYRDMERSTGYMYYPTNGTTSGMNNNVSHYTEPMMRDPREGRSAIRRRMYMEGKQMHKDANSQLQELEAYLQELSSDITEMVRDASPEEKEKKKKKMSTLANKIA